jgi:ornithine cyclodeaminase/alanine dehydrogenase
MTDDGTLLLHRSEVEHLLNIHDCIEAVENVFRLQGEGKISTPGILGVKTAQGGLHVKAGVLPGARNYIVAKLNSNFPRNRFDNHLPTIQGVLVLYDGANGRPLAVIDSIDITIKRTAAASAVAARYLARSSSCTATICGCGQQAGAQLRALRAVLPLRKVYAFDLDHTVTQQFGTRLSDELDMEIEPVPAPGTALRKSDVCVTSTTSTAFFVSKEDVVPGTFIAAVGADDSHKQEIDPLLLASAKVVVDSLDQACAIGDTQHAIAQGLMHRKDVYAELSEIVAGRKPGRTNDDEIFIFDSTGVAIEDAVAAIAVYEKAVADPTVPRFNFAS